MKTCATVLSIAALSLSFLSMPLIADDKSADQKTNSAVTHHFRTSAIEGMVVRNAAGEDLGKVKDLVIDLESGTIVYAALDFGGFIGIGDKLFAVPWDAFKIGTTDKEEHLVLATTKEKLTKAPGFDKNHWPVLSDPAWSHVDEFYGPLRTAQKSTKDGVTTVTTNKANLSKESSTKTEPLDRANTGVNARDRGTKAKTPLDQGENKADIKTTVDIRKRVVAEKMSSDAHNVKIITQEGKVTLRGPVNTADEKKKIDEIAADVAGASKVDSQLEVIKK